MPIYPAPTLIKKAKIWTGNDFIIKDLFIMDGFIKVCPEVLPPNTSIIEGENLIVSPGFIDLHAHLREPGFSYKETISTGTRAAAAGGFTTVCAMPNLIPAPDSLENLKFSQRIIDKDALIEVQSYGTLTLEQKGESLSDIDMLSPFCVGFSDDGLGLQSESLALGALKKIAKSKSFMTAHCENELYLNKDACVNEGMASERFNLPGISAISEWSMVERDLKLVEMTGARYHVCHISTKESIDLVRKAKARGLPVTSECTPHHLTLDEEDIIEDDGRFKMNPPLRSRPDKEALIEGFLDGTIDCIATDHAPHCKEEKDKGLAGSSFGVVGFETAFSVCYTHMVKTGLCNLGFLLNKLTFQPAKILDRDIDLIEGAEANLVVIDLSSTWQVDNNEFLSKGRSSPFTGYFLQGQVVTTFYKGRKVYERN